MKVWVSLSEWMLWDLSTAGKPDATVDLPDELAQNYMTALDDVSRLSLEIDQLMRERRKGVRG